MGIFSWDNVKMQIIPWCAYPLSAVAAVACRNSWITKGTLLAAAGLAVYVSGALLTRTVFLSGGIAIAATILLFIVKAGRKRQVYDGADHSAALPGGRGDRSIRAGGSRILHGLGGSLLGHGRRQPEIPLGKLHTANVPESLGGGDALLEDHLWAHNLPLDMGLLYGIPGFLCMIWLLFMLVQAVVRWTGGLSSEIKSIEVLLLSMFIGALISSMVGPPDIAYLTPMLLVAAFAKERTWIAYSRSAALRNGNSLAQPLQIEKLD